MLFKALLVGLVAYLGYKKIVKPMLLPSQKSPKKYQDPIEDGEYLEYEEVD